MSLTPGQGAELVLVLGGVLKRVVVAVDADLLEHAFVIELDGRSLLPQAIDLGLQLADPLA